MKHSEECGAPFGVRHRRNVADQLNLPAEIGGLLEGGKVDRHGGIGTFRRGGGILNEKGQICPDDGSIVIQSRLAFLNFLLEVFE